MWECTFTNEVLYGNIIVDKVTVPSGDPQLFTFTPSWGSTFQLADATTPHDSGPILAGTYSVSETVPTGWDLTNVTCLSDDGVTRYLPTAINLSPMETVTCTFTNTKRGQIIVDKVTVPAGDSQLFTFTPSWGATFQLADATTPHNSGYLVPGTYSVAETVPTGWDLTSAVCSDGSPITSIDLAAGETVTCTFTNTKRGQIIVDKVTVPAGDTQMFTFTPSWGSPPATFQLADETTPHNSGYLIPGTYSIAETVPTGWVLTSATCSDGSPVTAISLQAGETVTCTFTNSKLPKLTLVKTVINNYGGTKVVADFPLFINTTPATSGMAYTLTPGSYTASETQQFGYTASPWGGDCAADGSVTLVYGDNKTCTITNSDIQPMLYVIKVVDNKGYGTLTPADFTMYVTGTNVSTTGFPGESAPGTLVTLNQGTYAVTEDEDPMYSAYYSADCSGTIMVGQTKTCTITNTLMIPGWTPGFWKNHAAGAPHGKDAWQYTAFMPGDLLDDVFELGMVAGLPVKGSSTGFIDKTLLEALGFRGGGGEAGAAEILLRAAVASLLNASFAEEYGAVVPGLFFPMTVDEVIEAVNEALASYDRYEMLTLAAELDMINNGSWEFPWHLLP